MGMQDITSEQKLENIVNSINSKTRNAASFYKKKKLKKLMDVMEQVIHECREYIALKEQVKGIVQHPVKGLSEETKSYLSWWHKDKNYSKIRAEHEALSHKRGILTYIPRFAVGVAFTLAMIFTPCLNIQYSHAEWLDTLPEQIESNTNGSMLPAAYKADGSHGFQDVFTNDEDDSSGSDLEAKVESNAQQIGAMTQETDIAVMPPNDPQPNITVATNKENRGEYAPKEKTNATPAPEKVEVNGFYAEKEKTNAAPIITEKKDVSIGHSPVVQSNAEPPVQKEEIKSAYAPKEKTNVTPVAAPIKVTNAKAPAKDNLQSRLDIQEKQTNLQEVRTVGAKEDDWSYVTYTAQRGDTATSIIKRYQGIGDDMLIHTRIEEFNRDNPSTKRDFISFPGGRFVKVEKDGFKVYKYLGGKRSDKPDNLGDHIVAGAEYKVRVYKNSI